ncbi:MAG TPA: hypothetical protein VH575_11905, partial [Gemmataceae bacterium]
LADIRSDLYSLGSTWYHLLAGQPPFPKGGLGERLNRIMNEEPEDVRRFNPRVGEAMAAVLHHMMAKDPRQRYQTPAELLRDLEGLGRGESPLSSRQLLEGLAEGDDEPIASSRQKGRRGEDGRRTPRPLRGPSRPDTEAHKSTAAARGVRKGATRPHLGYGLAGAGLLVLVVVFLLAFSSRPKHKKEAIDPETASADSSINKPPSIPPLPPPGKKTTGETPRPPDKISEPPVVKKPSWPALYRPSIVIDPVALRKEIEVPWAAASAPAQTVERVVGRLPPDPSGKTFRSLAAACKDIPAGATGVIELRDNGPFFDVPAVVRDRSLVIRPAKGYCPLLVWDVERMLDERRRYRDKRKPAETEPLIFLDVQNGSLTLEGVHVALRWPEASSEGAAVLRVAGGDLTVTDCTFSVVGKPRDGVTLARFTASGVRGEGSGVSKTAASSLTPDPSSLTPSKGGRCRFTRCYLRGAGMSALDLNAPGAQVLFDNCLLVGGDAPLLQVRAGTGRPIHLRAVRSTMICGKNLLHVRSATEQDRDPAFHWLGWDVLLSRGSGGSGGELLRLDGGISARNMSWRAINCLYAGWETLLAGTPSIAAADLSAWRRLWKRGEGDEVHSKSWPSAFFPEPAELPAATYRTADSPVAFAASTGAEQLLGCDLDRLPPLRGNWLSLTFDRFPILAPSVPDNAEPPVIPPSDDGLYHGERLDLNQTDPGAYLQNVQRTYRLAPQVVLHLAGSGEHFTTPLRIKGSSLVLYFEPPPEQAEPLVLVPAVRGTGDALVEVEGGSLDIVNGRLRFAESAQTRRILPWLIKVRGGDVRLFRTHLEVPPNTSGTRFRGLVLLDGSGDPAAERVCSCAANETVLLSAREGIRIQGIGARLLLTQTLLIAGSDAVRLTLDPGFAGKANVQCLLDRVTVAASGSVVHVPDVKPAEPPAEPVIVQTHGCAFLNLFGRMSRPSLVLYDGEALARGLLVWQGDGDSFDRRLWYAAASADAPLPDKNEDRASWLALWGPSGLSRSKYELPPIRSLDPKSWSLELLAKRKLPGADLEKLDLVRKPMTNGPR